MMVVNAVKWLENRHPVTSAVTHAGPPRRGSPEEARRRGRSERGAVDRPTWSAPARKGSLTGGFGLLADPVDLSAVGLEPAFGG